MTHLYRPPVFGEPLRHSGQSLPCKVCGKELHSSASICPSCGASQRQRAYKSKTLAAVFALFLGGLGIHRFYLGQWWGIFYLLCSWLLIPSLVAFIEFIVFIAMDQRIWDDKYNDGKPSDPVDDRSNIAVWVILAVFAFLIMAGILAAIAIPAYQDYIVRRKVFDAWVETRAAREEVSEYILRQGTLPSSNQTLNLPQPWILNAGHRVTVSPRGIELQLTGSRELEGKTLLLSPVSRQDWVDWKCRGGTLEPRYRPAPCR